MRIQTVLHPCQKLATQTYKCHRHSSRKYIIRWIKFTYCTVALLFPPTHHKHLCYVRGERGSLLPESLHGFLLSEKSMFLEADICFCDCLSCIFFVIFHFMSHQGGSCVTAVHAPTPYPPLTFSPGNPNGRQGLSVARTRMGIARGICWVMSSVSERCRRQEGTFSPEEFCFLLPQPCASYSFLLSFFPTCSSWVTLLLFSSNPRDLKMCVQVGVPCVARGHLNGTRGC